MRTTDLSDAGIDVGSWNVGWRHFGGSLRSVCRLSFEANALQDSLYSQAFPDRMNRISLASDPETSGSPYGR